MIKKFGTPTLKTKRLLLKPCCVEDSKILQNYFNNWNIIKNINAHVPWPYPENGQADYYENVLKPEIEIGNLIVWTIFEKEKSDTPIGRADYRLNIQNKDTGERGFWLAEPFWNKGYMTEAITALNNYAFDVLDVGKMTLTNFINNQASRRVKEKTGAIYLKTIEEPWRDEIRKVEIWELRAENWKKFREK